MPHNHSNRHLQPTIFGPTFRRARRYLPGRYLSSALRIARPYEAHHVTRVRREANHGCGAWFRLSRAACTALFRGLRFIGKLLLSDSLPVMRNLLVLGGCSVFFVAVAGEVRSQSLVVMPVAVPESFAKRGYSAQYVAERVAARMNEIGMSAQLIPHDSEITVTDTPPPDIQVPEEGLSVSSTVYYLKKFWHRDDVTVRIGIAQHGSSYLADIELEGGPFDHRHKLAEAVPGEDLSDFVNHIGDNAVGLAQPSVFASYLITEEQRNSCTPDRCQFDDAQRVYNEAMRDAPAEERQWALAGKASILLIQNRIKEAEKTARKALGTYPDFGLLSTYLAVSLERQHRCDEALLEFGRGANKPPYTSDRLRLWGDALLHAGHAEDALAKFRDAVKLNPKLAQNFHDWGEALIEVHRYDEAIEKLSLAVERDPNLASAYVEWGRALEAKGDVARAIQKYEQAIDIDMKNPWAHKYLSDALRKTGWTGDAVEPSAEGPDVLNASLPAVAAGQICPKGKLDDRNANAETQSELSFIAVTG